MFRSFKMNSFKDFNLPRRKRMHQIHTRAATFSAFVACKVSHQIPVAGAFRVHWSHTVSIWPMLKRLISLTVECTKTLLYSWKLSWIFYKLSLVMNSWWSHKLFMKYNSTYSHPCSWIVSIEARGVFLLVKYASLHELDHYKSHCYESFMKHAQL